MFWRFGFSSTSSLDTLLDRPNVTLEEILDEDELLQECKTQNSKLINYLQQPRVLKRLFEHVVGSAEVGGPGGKEWEEKVRFKYPYIASEVLSSDIWSIVDTALSNSGELLVPFWDAILSRGSTSNPPTITQHQHPLFSEQAPNNKSNTEIHKLNVDNVPTVPGEESSGTESSHVGVLGLDVKANDEGTTLTTARDNGPGKSVLAGYWAKVNGVFLDKKPREMIAFIRNVPQIVELFVAHMETPAVVDLLYRIIQCEEAVPNIGVIDWLSTEELMSRLIELLSPSHSTDLHNTVSELLKAIIALSAPSPASLTQGGGAEAFGFGGTDSMGAQNNGPVGGVNNRLVRELASEPTVRKMVGFMLDASLPSRLSRRLSEAAEERQIEDNKRNKPSLVGAEKQTLSSLSETPLEKGTGSHSGDSALDDEDDDLEFSVGPSRRPLNPRDTPASGQISIGDVGRSPGVFDHHRDSTATIRPSTKHLTPVCAPEIQVTPESCTSTLVTCIGVLIELIRKNNSDYFEQHLFHTLRTHLLQRQQEIAERKANKTVSVIAEEKDEEAQLPENSNAAGEGGEEDEDDEMEGMEEAMAELSDKLGIVHLGPMLRVLCERLSDFQTLISRPRVENVDTINNSLGKCPALTFERYRITELYAELLHCSNMALLNRAPGEGPQYSEEGILQGGIEGLQVLARTLQGGDAASESGQDHITIEKSTSQTENADVIETKEDPTDPGQSKGRHTRQSSVVGGGVGSEDTDDEALLSEVSLNESTNDTEKTHSIADSATTSDAQSTEATQQGSPKEEETPMQEDDEDIKSVLSHLSLADLTAPSPSPSKPPSPIDDRREYNVGDLLKKKFLECDVIPTILSLFFEFPWNNFLHNVVYDILQQFFNGRMDVGLNRKLTLAVFEQAKLTEKIVEGEKRNEESLKLPRKIRLGYMGHMHLIAEETVKLLERYPEEIGKFVEPFISTEWKEFVDQALKENREKEAAPLAGGRPQMLHSLAFPQHGGGTVDGDLGGVGQSVGSDAFANYLSSQMGTSNASDDDDSDEDTNWLSQDMRQRNLLSGSGDGFDDVFEPESGSGSGIGGSRRGNGLGDDEDEEDDDDDWGPFADSSSSSAATATNVGTRQGSSAQAYLTPADWAADFQRETSANDDLQNFDGGDDGSSNASDGGQSGEKTIDEEQERERSNSTGSDTNGTPFVDLLDSASLRASDVVAAAHARRPSLEKLEGISSSEQLRIPRPRGSSTSGSSTENPLGISVSSNLTGSAIDENSPIEEFGPGVSPDAQTDPVTGLLERTIDGETVKVPLDEAALLSQSPPSQQEKVEQEEKK